MNEHFPQQPRTSGQSNFSQPQAEQHSSRKTRTFIGGILLTILLLASTLAAFLVLDVTHLPAKASGGAPAPTPTPITPAPGEPIPHGSLYIAAPGSLTRTDLKTNHILWTIQASSPSAPLVMGKTLFFDDEDAATSFVEAATTKAGTQVWRSQKYGYGFLLGSGNTLYDSLCNFSSTDNSCYLYGINASTGALRWSYDLHQGSTWIALQNGVIYGVSYTQYFALNASTGVPLWQKNLLNYTDQEATMTPVVHGNVLSFASCNVTKQSSGYTGCYLYAFNAHTGQELWHISTTSSLHATPTIMNGVIYEGTTDGTIYAFKEQNGEQLWSANADGSIGQLLSNAGIVYVETLGPDGLLHIEAFDAATHAPRWGQITPTYQSLGATIAIPFTQSIPHSGGGGFFPFVLDHGLIYFQNSFNVIIVLNTKDGSPVTQYAMPGNSINGFTIVGQ